MAMLLPASFGASRRMNDTHDIRKNLRFRTGDLSADTNNANEEYVQAEISSLLRNNNQSRISGRYSKSNISNDWLIDCSYCVTFQLTKISKACHKEKGFETLQDGGIVCVRCEKAATRHYLGGRCTGHGVEGRPTRWTALTDVDCHGKWIRRTQQSQLTCPCNQQEDASFIFVWFLLLLLLLLLLFNSFSFQ